ncbi:hypothetical protein RHSIM_Rhsim13G0182500 [Rhododendron simsii]|uniref:GDSL esterase/lipase n=1 Tax=Rhododendron simsii TaxID=118357 RepID=A0A834FYX7_RHOSS|nr:hypothetical protein RHSIM_Rhsim13G0182500 [Rhododendron simsii]
MSTQLQYFKEYKARLASTIGQEGADNLTTNAVFFVNCAVNDFVNTFYGPGRITLPAGTTIGQYEDFVLQQLLQFIQVQAALRTQQNSAANIGLKLAYFDTYTPMVNIRRNPAAFGIDVTNRGCCGTGLLEQGPLCNSLSALCANRSEYEFFDSVHPTQTTASIILNANVAAINSITS